MRKYLFICITSLYMINSLAQETSKNDNKMSFALSADLVNRYIWRGLLISPNVSIQPYAALTYNEITLSAWSSYGISEKYAEVDFTLSYKIKNLTVSINDYFNQREDTLALSNHFDFKHNTTKHALEASLNYIISEDLPLNLTAATFFYGNDLDSTGNNYYSTYFEIAYPFTSNEYSFNIFIGGTPKKGFYSDNAAIVNAGLTTTKTIKISDSFSIPMSASLVSNPKAEAIFMILKLTF